MAKPAKKASTNPAKQTRTRDIPVLVIAAIGMAITAYLTAVAWWETAPAFCSAGSSCDAIQQSRWSTVLGLPLSFWGFGVYALIALFAFRPLSRLRRWKRIWNVSLVGLAISVYLTLVGWVQLDAFCGWCLASLLTITTLFALTAIRRPPSAPDMPWWNWLLNSGVLVIVFVGGLHIYYSGWLQTPTDPRLEPLAQHLETTGASFYGASWCVSCQQQKALFGDAAKALPYVECSPNGRGGQMAFACVAQNIESFPTWVIDGKRVVGVLQPEELARRSGFNWQQDD